MLPKKITFMVLVYLKYLKLKYYSVNKFLPFNWPLNDEWSSFCCWTEDEFVLDFPLSKRIDILIIKY